MLAGLSGVFARCTELCSGKTPFLLFVLVARLAATIINKVAFDK
jgi:hypothetical protein